ncbi:Autophagy- protein 33 [Amphichorda felina]
MPSTGVSVLKFVGTVSLGLLTGVSYSVSTLTLPTLANLPSASGCSHALTTLTSYLRLPVLTLTTLASAPFLLSFALSPRSARHPYLVYSSLLAILSAAAPSLLPQPPAAAPRPSRKQPSPARAPRNLEASYEVLGDVHSEAPSEEEVDEFNGEEVRAELDGIARGFLVRAGLATLGFAMAVVGIWGDGAPQAVVYVS